MKQFHKERKNYIFPRICNRGNEFAISSGGIGDALQRSASALSNAKNSLSESIALTVAANNVVQDPDVVGKHICSLKSGSNR